MGDEVSLLKEKIKDAWGRIRYWIGYGLFLCYVIYSIYQAPDILWNLNLRWLALAVGCFVFMFSIEIAQFFVFLRHHHIPLDILVPIRFTARKSIFNAILPAKTGTLVFLYLITRHYKLEWHEYIRFMLTTTVVMLVVSGIILMGLIFQVYYSLLTFVLACLGIGIIKRYMPWGYLRAIVPLLFIAVGSYLCRLFIFWALLNSAGYELGFKVAGYFAIVTMALAQVSITPGNAGIREVMLGWLAPYLALPMSVGVIIGALVQVIRMMVYAVILVVADLLLGDRLHESPSKMTPVDDKVKL